MSGLDEGLADRAGELRRAFDQSFAEAARPRTETAQDLLAFRIDGEPYALRLAEVAGVFADRRITRLPSTARALLGLAGLRGVIAPVYDLHALLGGSPAETPRWIVLARDATAALAIDDFEGHFSLPSSAILPRDAGQTKSSLIDAFAQVQGQARAIVDVSAVLQLVGAQTGPKA